MSHLHVLHSVLGHLNQEKDLADTDLQKAARIVLLNHFQAVLHEACGLAQLHRAV